MIGFYQFGCQYYIDVIWYGYQCQYWCVCVRLVGVGEQFYVVDGGFGVLGYVGYGGGLGKIVVGFVQVDDLVGQYVIVFVVYGEDGDFDWFRGYGVALFLRLGFCLLWLWCVLVQKV